MHLGKMLEGAERRWGSKTAVKLGDDTLSYTELNSASNRLAHSLRALGIKRGDRVVILLNNSLQFVISYFGIVKLGAIAVPLDTKYRLKELSCLFEDCRPKAIIMEEPFVELLEGERGSFPYIKIVIEKENAVKEGHFSIEELVEKGLDEPLEDGA
ncbi:MAG: acyl--CoA ligase, partial [Chloroflexi bacterium]|nr:acyl--CoA ligase [Chloroflexota bacterium]